MVEWKGYGYGKCQAHNCPHSPGPRQGRGEEEEAIRHSQFKYRSMAPAAMVSMNQRWKIHDIVCYRYNTLELYFRYNTLDSHYS